MVLAVTALVILASLHGATASIIVTSSSPAEVKDGLTQHVSLTCSLNDTAPSAGIVGRRRRDLLGDDDVTDDVTGGEQRRDVTETADNVAQVMSIVVRRHDVDIASVSSTHAARRLVADSNMQVSGSLSQQPGDRGQGHLTVTFTDFPTEAQLGSFTCEVNALDDVGHSVTFVTSHQVKVTEPSMADVIQHMQELTLQNQQLEEDNRNQTSLIADLQSGLVEVQHIESGSLECGDSSKGWTNTTSTPSSVGYTYHDVSHTFARAYSTAPPHLQYGVVDVYYYDVHTAMSYVIYYVDVVSVSQQGFHIRCRIENTGKFHVGRLTVSWSAFPRQ